MVFYVILKKQKKIILKPKCLQLPDIKKHAAQFNHVLSLGLHNNLLFQFVRKSSGSTAKYIVWIRSPAILYI
jgi:hypothetical protein